MNESLPSWLKLAATLTPTQLASLTSEDRAAIAAELDKHERQQLYNDPVLFFRRYLGVEPWEKQAEVLRAVAGSQKVAVRSGHKIGKSNSAAGLALWWYSTRPRALVVMTSATDDQVRLILWAELQRLYRNAKRPIEGQLHEAHRTGLVAADGRKIVGISTNKTENMGGFSGAELLFIADEASGIDEEIFEAIEGNRAGGARLVMFGNPTRTSGTFYQAFHGKKQFWKALHVSSEQTPNVVQGKTVIPGLATAEWVKEKLADWGEESPLFQVRVRGNFPSQAENAVIGLSLVESAQGRYEETPESGALTIGVDVARFGDDETVIWPVRGKKALRPTVLKGADTVQVAGRVLELAKDLAKPGETPTVRVDVIGVGAGVVDHLKTSQAVYTVAVNAGAGASDATYARCRDELWFTLKAWLQDGGAIPVDDLLHGELVTPTYSFLPSGKIKVESKDEIKKRLSSSRSTDRADALALAVYGVASVASSSFDAPSSEAYWDKAEEAKRVTNLVGFV